MKGALYVIIAIVLLLIGILVIKNMQTETITGVQKKEIIEHTEKVVEDVEDKMDALQKKINKTE